MERQTINNSQIESDYTVNNPLYTEFARQTLSPPGDDTRIALFFQGLLTVVHGRDVPKELQTVVVDNAHQLRIAAEQTNTSASYAANKILRCFQKQFMYRLSDQTYPYTDSSVLPWRDAIIQVMSTELFDEVIEDMYTRETQSNVVQRYNALKFILAACLDSTNEPPNVIDVGCSQNLGLKKIGSAGEFESVRIASGVAMKTNGSLRTLSRRYNRTVSQPVQLGRSLGLDLFDYRKSTNVEWVYACSSYPSELLQAKRLQETKELQNIVVPEVAFAQGDVTTYLQYTTTDKHKFRDRRRYDVAFASTVLYQMTETEREATYDNIYDHLKPNGMLVVQDFVELTNGRLKFSGPGSERFQYRTYIKDKRGDYEKPEEFFTWENARCTRVKLGLGRVSIQGAELSLSQLLVARNKVKPAL